MKKFKVVFKNGEIEVISSDIMNVIRDNILSGSKTFLFISDKEDNVIIGFNLLEVAYFKDIDYNANKL